jgi:hypothetical protein
VDPATCTYAFASAEPQGSGLNVRVLYQDVAWKLNPATKEYDPEIQSTTEQEILDAEDTEGFTQLANQQFQLSKGLCSLVHAATNPPPSPAQMGPPVYHTISAVYASDACASKTQLLPICKQDRNTSAATADGGTTTDVTCNVPVELVPAPSAVYLVMDDSSEMGGAFGDTGSATAMSLSLAAPVFKRTYVAFQFLKHQAGDCTASMPSAATPDLDFGLARSRQPVIAQKLLQWAPPSGGQDLDVEAAMRPQGAYARIAQFEQGLGEQLDTRAVMFFLNRTPTGPLGGVDAGGGDGGLDPTVGPDCDPPLAGGTDALSAIEAEVTAAASATPSMHTFFVVLDNAQHNPPLAFFQQVGNATGAKVLDATSANRQQVLGSFAQTAVQLGTCLYEKPTGIDSNAKITFTNPLQGPTQGLDLPPVPFAAACNAASAATTDGWNVDGNRIRICGNSCTTLRQLVLLVTAQALQQGETDGGADGGTGNLLDGGVTPPEVPVKATMPCVTTPGM